MENQIDTEKVIADLINATCGKEAATRQKHHFRESLRSLVRLARAELLLEMRMNVSKLTGHFGASAARPKKKNTEHGTAEQLQHQFEFSRFDL